MATRKAWTMAAGLAAGAAAALLAAGAAQAQNVHQIQQNIPIPNALATSTFDDFTGTSTQRSTNFGITFNSFNLSQGILLSAAFDYASLVQLNAHGSAQVSGQPYAFTMSGSSAITLPGGGPAINTQQGTMTVTCQPSANPCVFNQLQTIGEHSVQGNIAQLGAFATNGPGGTAGATIQVLDNQQVSLNLPASNTSNVNADTATLSETVSTDVLFYSYVQHAVASFNSGSTQTTLDLNFGTLQQGALATTFQEALFNLGGFGADGLVLNNTSQTGSGPFEFLQNIPGFVVGGASGAFGITMGTSRIGDFNETLELNLADENLGGIGEQTYHLFIDMTGDVVAPPPPVITQPPGVPEPSSWALLLLGFASLGAALRVSRARRMAISA
ncbi:PEPxxWA-CTERM sorting domain-containing protein [Phenylobacterium sp.]|uniref:PEPxxWA-CTERM sorting domain-containing protein n=1 Tax=Phenylobacterium sp. TaxID=1871053 RepID=UPI00121A4322|nr:PEPxxWA-CTERM sorting domain-containing protein [Phenylobacterium sp.]THD50562.1 MAG: PEP-CTERM sorting domain-containing protein [Phenylobacterium sp.]